MQGKYRRCLGRALVIPLAMVVKPPRRYAPSFLWRALTNSAPTERGLDELVEDDHGKRFRGAHRQDAFIVSNGPLALTKEVIDLALEGDLFGELLALGIARLAPVMKRRGA